MGIGYAIDRVARQTAAGAVSALLPRLAALGGPVTRLVLGQGDMENFVSAARLEWTGGSLSVDIEWPDSDLPEYVQDTEDAALDAFVAKHGLGEDADGEQPLAWHNPFGLPRCVVIYELLSAAEHVVAELGRAGVTFADRSTVMVGNRADCFDSASDFLRCTKEAVTRHLPDARARSGFAKLLYQDPARQRWFTGLPRLTLVPGAASDYSLFKQSHAPARRKPKPAKPKPAKSTAKPARSKR
jgi:hypothetical protein